MKIINKAPVLLLGIGNILLHDEGIGSYAVTLLRDYKLPDYVELVDGGTAGADLLDCIAERQKVIIVDAVDADVPAGTIMKFKPQDLAADSEQMVSLHQFGVAETLNMAKYLNAEPKDVVIIGIKPFDLSVGVGISEKLTAKLPILIDIILLEINSFEAI